MHICTLYANNTNYYTPYFIYLFQIWFIIIHIILLSYVIHGPNDIIVHRPNYINYI